MSDSTTAHGPDRGTSASGRGRRPLGRHLATTVAVRPRPPARTPRRWERAVPWHTAARALKCSVKQYTFYSEMDFEYDEAKSRANREKHGIDFSEARQLWNDPDLLEVPARTADEPRFLVIAKRQGRHWSAVITYRDNRIRIISVRRSRTEEIELHESEGI